MEKAKDKAGRYELTEENFRYVIPQIPFSGVKVNPFRIRIVSSRSSKVPSTGTAN